eukprot:TRINITY_DN3578_c0_g1_i1.p1 TRINITY_DN3578_c0_g1~~TRINITY_DN3578_c0_g1_i1.p1  ORF type:complete len:272 (-),score=-36.62 TRINITY_DN3578_c0_g1_i1:859-1674(-)
MLFTTFQIQSIYYTQIYSVYIYIYIVYIYIYIVYMYIFHITKRKKNYNNYIFQPYFYITKFFIITLTSKSHPILSLLLLLLIEILIIIIIIIIIIIPMVGKKNDKIFVYKTFTRFGPERRQKELHQKRLHYLKKKQNLEKETISQYYLKITFYYITLISKLSNYNTNIYIFNYVTILIYQTIIQTSTMAKCQSFSQYFLDKTFESSMSTLLSSYQINGNLLEQILLLKKQKQNIVNQIQQNEKMNQPTQLLLQLIIIKNVLILQIIIIIII